MIINCQGIKYPVNICSCGKKNGLSTAEMHSEEYSSESLEVVELQRCDICGAEYIFIMLYEGEFEIGIILELVK